MKKPPGLPWFGLSERFFSHVHPVPGEDHRTIDKVRKTCRHFRKQRERPQPQPFFNLTFWRASARARRLRAHGIKAQGLSLLPTRQAFRSIAVH